MPHYKDSQNKVHFLDSEEHESLLPEGCVMISDEEAASLMPPPPSFAELAEAYLSNELAPLRERVLDRLSGIQGDALVDGDTTLVVHARAARQSIKDLPQHAAVLAAMASEDYEALRNAYKLAYDEARAGADPSVVNAFKALDV